MYYTAHKKHFKLNNKQKPYNSRRSPTQHTKHTRIEQQRQNKQKKTNNTLQETQNS